MKLPKVFMPEKDFQKKIEELGLEHTIQKENYHDFSPGDYEAFGWDHALHFNDSLDFLRKHGCERHFRPWEYFGSIIDHLECNLKEGHEKLAKEMLKCEWGGVWLSMAFERRDDKLICYMDPENIGNITTGVNSLSKEHMGYSAREEFDINPSFRSDGWTYLENFNDDFVEYFFTRKFKDLPKFMREGRKEAKVWIPPQGVVWPVCTDDPPYLANNSFGLNGHTFGPRCCLGLRRR